jgi:hypothetical protein
VRAIPISPAIKIFESGSQLIQVDLPWEMDMNADSAIKRTEEVNRERGTSRETRERSE